jgi:hypothetical protein
MSNPVLLKVLVFFIIINCFLESSQSQTSDENITNCLGADSDRHPVIIDTDSDIDDLWAILYLINVSINTLHLF